MSTPIVKGNSAVHDHHRGGTVTASERITKTFAKQGRYADLALLQPRKGGYFEGLKVVQSELTRAKGGMGLLIVTCLIKGGHAGAGGRTAGADEIVYEVEMAQLEKPLLSNPHYKDYADQIEMWRGSDPATRANLGYTDADGNDFVLAGNAAKAARLILQGVESYLVFSPVCRRTTRISETPDDFEKIGKDCGKKCDPPATCLSMVAGTWDWLKTADRAVQTAGGGSERVEEWTGADEWSDDLYERA